MRTIAETQRMLAGIQKEQAASEVAAALSKQTLLEFTQAIQKNERHKLDEIRLRLHTHLDTQLDCCVNANLILNELIAGGN